jgi:hypothetical protein
VVESINAMEANLHRYKLADLQDATNLFLLYAADTRNRDARVVLVEEYVSFAIAPAPHDPTGAPIEVEGTVDQVRVLDNGLLAVGDIKTSKRDPMEVLLESTFQLAAYVIGSSIKLERKVSRALCILPRKYTKDIEHSPVFWHHPWNFDDVEHILERVRNAVADVRSGRIGYLPSANCKWCHQRSPDICLPKLKRFKSGV